MVRDFPDHNFRQQETSSLVITGCAPWAVDGAGKDEAGRKVTVG
jgi:hypothetical protein